MDTSFFFAASEPGDYEHAKARRLFESLDRPRLITTNHVRGETWSLLRRRSGHYRAVQFLDLLEDSNSVRTVNVTPKTELSALTWLRRHGEREYSFVDATSFAFMRENGIGEALAFDGDFTAAGFVELRA